MKGAKPRGAVKQARALLKRLYVDGVDADEGDCLYCKAECECHDDCIMLEIEKFLGIEIPDEDYLPGGPERRYYYVDLEEE